MKIYDLMTEYAGIMKLGSDTESLTPNLGHDLSLFHSCLAESGLKQKEVGGHREVVDPPEKINTNHLSHFIVGFLPFNSVTEKTDINHVLFEVYSFFRWLDAQKVPHGLNGLDFQQVVKDLSGAQERCLQLSHLLDDECGRILEDIPEIVETISDMFSVTRIDGPFIHLQGRRQPDPIRLRLPDPILNLVELKDHLDLVLGDTSDRWVVLEAGQVYPEYPASGNRRSN